MNARQKQAVFTTEGPLLILAGAGSGKTTVLCNRIANLIANGDSYHSEELYVKSQDYDSVGAQLAAYVEHGTPLPQDTVQALSVNPCRPWQILAITFTNKAAGELKTRLCNLLGAEGNDIWAATFHSTCARILRKDGDRLGFTSHFTIYDMDDVKRLMKDCYKTLSINEKLLPIRSVLGEISRAKDNLETPKDFAARVHGDFRLSQIAKVYQLYSQKLKAADAMDFDDLLFHTVTLLQTCPDVLAYYQKRFRYVMVDEYQDTNHVQFLLVKLLSSGNQNLCVVGDDDQSIYKFRGATIENILSFEQTFPRAKVIRLEQNYRSTQTILDAANAVIENNKGRKGKKLWTEKGKGKAITLHTTQSELDEASVIGKTILDNVEQGRKYSDHAVLYRMNAQSNALERVFVKSGIRYRMLGGVRFYERKEIRDVLAYLSVISNPTDEIRLRRILNVPRRAIGDKTVAVATEIADGLGESLFYVAEHAEEFPALGRAAPKLMGFAKMIRNLRAVAEENTLEELYDALLDATSYLAYIKDEDDNVEERLENLEELRSNLVQYTEDYDEDATLSGFLEEVSLMTDIDQLEEGQDACILMTIHAAKGLEFPIVFVPGLEEGVFPGIQSMYDEESVEEERRLAYVAYTRAKEELHLLHAESRMLYGSTSRNRLSRFVEEIPSTLLATTKTKTATMPVPAAQQKFAGKPWSKPVAPTPSGEKLQPGDNVEHKTFGIGMVLSATPMGNDTLLEIAFEREGTKKIMANFAKLKKL